MFNPLKFDINEISSNLHQHQYVNIFQFNQNQCLNQQQCNYNHQANQYISANQFEYDLPNENQQFYSLNLSFDPSFILNNHQVYQIEEYGEEMPGNEMNEAELQEEPEATSKSRLRNHCKQSKSLRLYTLPPEIKNEREERRVCKTPIEKRIPILRASRESRNNFTLQQTLCICLLSQHCKIVIKKPTRRSSVTEQFFRIETIIINNEEIDVSSFLKKRCNDLYLSDMESGVTEKTANRRYQNNKKIELIHLMEDYLRFFGVEFKTKQSESKIGINKLENIIGIYNQNETLILFDDIVSHLIEINHILLQTLLDSQGELIVDKNQFMLEF